MTASAISPGGAAIGTGTTGGLQATVETAAQNRDFAQSYADARQPAAQPVGAAPIVEPQSEISRAVPRNDSLGERILDRLEAVHRGDKPGNTNRRNASPDPIVKVAAAEPGPAASALRELPSAANLTTRAPSDGPGQFKNMLDQLQQAYGQVIQVSVVSKSSGTFTSSMNRLMSSA